jgi:AraC-like DNA-binding protein
MIDVAAMIDAICGQVNERRGSRTSVLVARIRSFLDSELANPELCLSLVAEQFGVSEVYLSRVFKEHTDESFLHYIERARVASAMRMLSGTTMSVKDVARRVGYRSSNTFCKAFRRIAGCTAGVYRTNQASTFQPSGAGS